MISYVLPGYVRVRVDRLEIHKGQPKGNGTCPLETSGNFIITVPVMCPTWGQVALYRPVGYPMCPFTSL